MTPTTIVPMALGDIFDRTIRLFGKTWLRNLILASLLLAIPIIVMSLGMDAFFSSLSAVAREKEAEGGNIPPELWQMLGSMSLLFLGIFIYLLASAAASLATTTVTCAEMTGQPMDWREALQRTFSVRFARSIGQYILEGLAIGALVAIPYAMLIAGIALRSVLVGLAGGFALIAAGCFAVFLGIRWAFTMPAIAWEDARVVQAFGRSWSLVSGQWWRVFGILLLMSLIVSFALSLLLTPLYLGVFWHFFSSYFERIGSLNAEQPDPMVFLQGFRSIGFGIGIISGLSAILQMLIKPLYMVVLYFDLRARKGEFHGTGSQESVTV